MLEQLNAWVSTYKDLFGGIGTTVTGVLLTALLTWFLTRRKTSATNSEALSTRLLKTLDEKDIAIEDRDEWIKKYNELEDRLSKRPESETLAVEARQKLKEGDLKGAEKLLKKSLAINLKSIETQKKQAAEDPLCMM